MSNPTTSKVLRRSAATLGENRGNPRVYLQGRWLARAGFTTGESILAEFNNGTLTLRLDDAGDRTVSGKSRPGTSPSVPVIDINTTQLRDALGHARDLKVVTRQGTITITPSKTAQHRARRVRNGLEGSVFAGGGLLTLAGRQAGFTCAWAIELNERYAAHFEARHPEAVMHNMSVHEVDGRELQQVELMTIGLPCEPFSACRNGRTGIVPEDHANGDLVYSALRLVEEVAPYTVVLEEVPGFLKSGAGFILIGALRRMGYTVEAKVINPRDYGELAGRKRAVVIATTDDAVVWPEPRRCTKRLGDILDDVMPDDEAWWNEESKAWWFKHGRTQRAKGNGFAGKVMTPETDSVPCIPKRYFNQQGQNPVVAHPTVADTYRWLSVSEVAKLHGVSGTYMAGLPKTLAGEMLGQGVVVSTFALVIESAAGRPEPTPEPEPEPTPPGAKAPAPQAPMLPWHEDMLKQLIERYGCQGNVKTHTEVFPLQASQAKVETPTTESHMPVDIEHVKDQLHVELHTFTDEEIIDGRTIAVEIDGTTYAIDTWEVGESPEDRVLATINFIESATLNQLEQS